MSEQPGWAEDPSRPPHLVLSTPLGSLRPESITPATVNGRELVVFAGTDEVSLPVRFVDLDSGVPLPDRSLLHSAHVVGLGLGSGRTLLATATARGTVAVREAETGVPIGPAIHGPESPLAVAIGLAGDRELVAVSYQDVTRVWDPADGTEVVAHEFGEPAQPTVLSHDGQVLTAVAGPSCALSVTGARSPYYGGPVRSFGGWAKRSGRMLAVLSGDPAMLYDVEAGLPFARVALPDFAPENPVEVALDGGGFRVFDTVRERELLRRDGQHDDDSVAVTAAGYRETDDKALLATGGADGSVRVWNVSARVPIGGPWHGHTGPVTAVALAHWRGQDVVLSTDASGTARMWMIGGPVRQAGHADRVAAVAGGVRAGRPVFASGGEDGTIRFWDPVTGAGVGEPIRSGPVTGLAFAGDILVSSGDGGTRRWDPATGEPIGRPLPGSGRVATAELDGRQLVAAVDGDLLRVWDAATGEPYTTMPLPVPVALQDLDVHDGRLLALTVSPPDRALFPEAACMNGEQITIWDVAAAEPFHPPMLTTGEGGLGAFGRAGGRLVAAHGVDARKNEPDDEGVWPEEAGDIYLRDIGTGELGTDFRPEAGANQQLHITRVRGRDVVLVAAETAVVIWDAATGREAAPSVRSMTGSITCVAAVEADGRTYGAAGDWAGTVRLWEIAPGS